MWSAEEAAAAAAAAAVSSAPKKKEEEDVQENDPSLVVPREQLRELNHDKKRTTTTNAFDVLMANSRKSGAMDLELLSHDECIRINNNNNDDERDNDLQTCWSDEDEVESIGSLSSFRNGDTRDWYDPVFQKVMEQISAEIYANSVFNGSTCTGTIQSKKENKDFSLEAFLDSFAENDDRNTASESSSNVIVVVPPSRSVPNPARLDDAVVSVSKQLALREDATVVVSKLTVCFGKCLNGNDDGVSRLRKQTYNSNDYWRDNFSDYDDDLTEHKKKLRPMLGFVVTYSDGVEVEIGNLIGTFFEATLNLQNDSIHGILLEKEEMDSSWNYYNYGDDDDDDQDELQILSSGLVFNVCVSLENESYFVFRGGTVKGDCGGDEFSSARSSMESVSKLKSSTRTTPQTTNSPLGCNKNDKSDDDDVSDHDDDDDDDERWNVPRNTKENGLFYYFQNELSKLVLPRRGMKPSEATEKNKGLSAERRDAGLASLGDYELRVQRICISAQKYILDWFLETRLHDLLQLEYESSQMFRLAVAGIQPRRGPVEVAEAIQDLLMLSSDEEERELKHRKQKVLRGAKYHLSALYSEFQPLACELKKKLGTERIQFQRCLQICKSCPSKSQFNPDIVRSRKRCFVPGCFYEKRNCGCTVSDCYRCFLPVCHLHTREDSHPCKEIRKKRCGWNPKEKKSRRGFCRTMLDDNDINSCTECGTQCCKDCFKGSCQGFSTRTSVNEMTKNPCPSGVSWCFLCQEMNVVDNQCHECEERDDDYDFDDDDDDDDNPDDSDCMEVESLGETATRDFDESIETEEIDVDY